MAKLQIRQSLLCTLLLLFSLHIQAFVTTEVDKTSLYQGEKLTLTLKIDSKADQRPNLKPLEQDFRLLGSRKTTLSQHSTENITTSTHWDFKLRAIKSGNIKIPPIQVADEYSSAITVNVLPSALNPAPEKTGLQPFFIDLEVDRDELYVNAQAILKVKVHHLKPLPLDSQLSSPSVRNAIVKKLEHRKEHKTQVNGQDYFVTEYSFTLFPIDEGAVEVEPFYFNTTLDNGETIDLSSSLLLLKVLPQAFTNSRDIWLPAQSIYLEDNLTEVTEATKGGDPIVRIITLEAKGVPSSSLPLLTDMINDQAEIKLKNVVLEEQMTDQGITSIRMEELEIFPTSDADVILPAISLPWWNTGQEQVRNAGIPERRITVKHLPPTATQVAPKVSPSQAQSSNILIWLLTTIAIIASVGCIYSWYFLRRAQAQSKPQKEPTQHGDAIHQLASDVAERNAFRALVMACEQSNPKLTKIRFIEWGQIFFKDMNLGTTGQVCDLAANGTLKFLVADMEVYLNGNPHLWHGELLLDEVEKVRNRRKAQEADRRNENESLSYQN